MEELSSMSVLLINAHKQYDHFHFLRLVAVMQDTFTQEERELANNLSQNANQKNVIL